MIECHFTYCPFIWMFCSKTDMQRVERVRYKTLLVVYNNYMAIYIWWPFSIELSKQTFVGLQDMSLRRLQHVFSVTFFRLPRRLQDVLEDEKLLRWGRFENVFKTYLEDVFKTFTENVYWEYLYLNNLKSVSDKSISHVSNLGNQGESKMH